MKIMRRSTGRIKHLIAPFKRGDKVQLLQRSSGHGKGKGIVWDRPDMVPGQFYRVVSCEESISCNSGWAVQTTPHLRGPVPKPRMKVYNRGIDSGWFEQALAEHVKS